MAKVVDGIPGCILDFGNDVVQIEAPEGRDLGKGFLKEMLALNSFHYVHLG